MKRTTHGIFIAAVILAFLSVSVLHAQTPNAYGYSTGYGTVYGSFGLAQTMQTMYNASQMQMRKAMARECDDPKVGTRGG